MKSRFPVVFAAIAVCVALPATTASAESKRQCTRVLFAELCAPSFSGPSRAEKKLRRESDEDQHVSKVRKNFESTLASRSSGEELSEDGGSAGGDSRMTAEERAAHEAQRAVESAARAEKAAARAAKYRAEYRELKDLVEEDPSEENLAARDEALEKYERTKATAKNAAQTAETDAKAAANAAAEANKGDEEQPGEDDQEQDEQKYEEQV